MSTAAVDVLRNSAELRHAFTHFPTFSRTMLKVKTKKRQIVPLVLNGEQEIIWGAVEEQINNEEPVRIAVLKPRQIGASTLCQGLTFWNITTHFNTNAIAIAHDADSTRRIFEMSTLFYDYMPIRPKRRYLTRQEIILEEDDEMLRQTEPGLRSRLEIRTAGKMGAGRSVTTHILHCSEVAQWPFPEDLISGLFPAVPYEPGTMIFMESTAHGAGDWWHEFWQQCHEPDSQFRPIFIPWFTVREYEMSERLTGRWMERRGIDVEEKRLKRLYKLTDGQLAWRRMRIKEMKGDEDLFRQEYPATEEEAWIVSGIPVFDSHRLLLALERTRKPAAIGYLDGSLTWHDDRKAPIKVWVPPRPDKKYVIGVDGASGAAGGDPSCMQVVDEEDTQVACWWGRLEPIALAHEVEKLARYYNQALVAIEIEDHGFATQAELRQRYYNLFRWRTMDRFADKLTDKIGWETNVKTKQILIAHMSHLIREGDCRINDREAVKELMRFIETSHGGEAAPGCHDDRVMALMIALHVNNVERPKGGTGGSVTEMPYERAQRLPPEVLERPDAYLQYDLGQHLPDEDEEESF
jgi:hypothetical protein